MNYSLTINKYYLLIGIQFYDKIWYNNDAIWLVDKAKMIVLPTNNNDQICCP
jgi:hypothetical protein